MSDVVKRCEWPMGTVWTGPRTCPNPAKFQTDNEWPALYPEFVCGVHVRSARKWGAVAERFAAADEIR